MRVLLIAKLAEHTLKENVLSPILASSVVDSVCILRDETVDDLDERVTIIPFRTNSKFRHFGKIFRGISFCKKNNIDIIVGVLNTPHGYIGRVIGKVTGVPFVYMTIAGHREFWLGGPLLEKFRIAFFKKSPAITVTGNQTKNYLLKKGFDSTKIFVLPNLPNPYFNELTINLNRHRKYDIVSFSRIDTNKNLILLVKAIAKLKENGIVPNVAVAGDGDQLQNIIDATKKYNVQECFDFLGYISKMEDKVRIYSDSKIFISCSKGEGFPVSLLEAMGCGCIPVVSNVGDIVDVINHGENGYVFDDTDNEEEVATLLLLVLSKAPEDYKKMVHSVIDIKQQISVERNGEIWRDIFNSVTK